MADAARITGLGRDERRTEILRAKSFATLQAEVDALEAATGAKAWQTATGVVKFGGSTSNVTSTLEYSLDEVDWCRWALYVTFTGAPAAGTLRIVFPFNVYMAGTYNAGTTIGAGVAIRTGVGRRTFDVISDATSNTEMAMSLADGGFLSLASNTSPWSWANTDAFTAYGAFKRQA